MLDTNSFAIEHPRLPQAAVFHALRCGAAALAMAALFGCATPPPQAPQRSAAEVEAFKRVRFEDTGDGARAVLDESILFEFGKAEFAGSADPVLDVLRPAFARARGLIIVEGHSDGIGTAAFNLDLSKRRADRVREALIQRQVPPERISSRGLGSSKPRKSPEINDDDRRLNRRAEFLFPGETVASLDGREVERHAETRLSQLSRVLKDTAGRVGNWLDRVTGNEKK